MTHPFRELTYVSVNNKDRFRHIQLTKRRLRLVRRPFELQKDDSVLVGLSYDSQRTKP